MTLSKDLTSISTDEAAAVHLLRLIATEAATWPPRLQAMFESLHDDEHPLGAIDYDPSTRTRSKRDSDDEKGDWEIADPTGTRATAGISTTLERARARRLVLKINDATRELVGMLQQHDPQPIRGIGASENSADWCANPAHPQGSRAPRDGRHKLCSWCRYIAREYGALPTAELLDRYERGLKLTRNTVRELLDA